MRRANASSKGRAGVVCTACGASAATVATLVVAKKRPMKHTACCMKHGPSRLTTQSSRRSVPSRTASDPVRRGGTALCARCNLGCGTSSCTRTSRRLVRESAGAHGQQVGASKAWRAPWPHICQRLPHHDHLLGRECTTRRLNASFTARRQLRRVSGAFLTLPPHSRDLDSAVQENESFDGPGSLYTRRHCSRRNVMRPTVGPKPALVWHGP